MDQRCRRCIRKAEKYPLELVSVNNNNIKDFKDIMEHTANRQKHFDRKLEYYKILDRNKFIENFKKDKLNEKVLNDKREKISIKYLSLIKKEQTMYTEELIKNICR